ncbi:MAG: long-chain fatty acid--CoA ligase [Crenarchaeota archaeon]|nr:long-chain fatty acid--CoA ligase [Thermoproteota archaeon]
MTGKKFCQKAWVKSINYPAIPLHELLSRAAENYPEKTAIVYEEQEITYAKLDYLTNQFSDLLLKLKIKKNDRIALYLPNTPQFIIAFFGALKAGTTLTTINPLHREREVECQLCDSGAETIVTIESLAPIVSKVMKKTKIKNMITTKLTDISFLNLPDGFSDKQPIDIQPNDLAALQYTGGTTGTLKAAVLTHRNLVANAIQFATVIGGTSADIFLAALPLFHIYGMTTSMTVPIRLCAKMVLMPKFQPVKTCEYIQQHKVTVFCGVPTMYQLLLDNPAFAKYDLTSIRVCISGASALPPQVQKCFMQFTSGFLAEGYGLTEASPVTHCNPIDKEMLRIGSIGLPLPDTEAKIVDLETGTSTLKTGEVGELAIKGPQVMVGYWQKPEETALVLHDGWLLTGDVARIDQDGFFYIIDRKKDIIKHKGYSIYPRELEDILYEHPSVKICAVVGKPIELGNEVPVAFIVLKDGAVVTKEELMAFVNGKVGNYKAIYRVELCSGLPLNAQGKVLRRILRGIV